MRTGPMVAATLGVLLLNTVIFASSFCACCVDAGFYDSVRERPDAYQLGMLDEMKFDPSAGLYMTEAGYDAVKGIAGLEKEISGDEPLDFNIVETFLKRTWNISFTTSKGKKGTLTLPMPAYMNRFRVDTRDEASEDKGLGVTLYKELKFVGKVSRSTGIFQPAGSSATTYTLIFQGSGNGCDSSADFKFWRLELRGPKTRFAMLGKLAAAGT